MRLLVLGGTVFVGRQVIDAALERGHHVTIFHRGAHASPFGEAVEELLGDRDGELAALTGRRWDAVIDTSGHLPRVVSDSARLLADATQRYVYISSVSAYADLSVVGTTEDAALAPPPGEAVEEVNRDTYGGLKAACEEVVRSAFGHERCLIIRPGLIVGPHDPTDRFTYWPVRVAAGGEILAPGSPDRAIQVIDVRDLATWMVRLLEVLGSGTFNAVGLERPLGMGELLETCRAVSGSDAALTWVDEDFLLEAGVAPWSDLPLWLPQSSDDDGVFRVDNTRAVGAGLGFRPPGVTIADTLEWFQAQQRPLCAGLTRERERALLAGYGTSSSRESPDLVPRDRHASPP